MLYLVRIVITPEGGRKAPPDSALHALCARPWLTIEEGASEGWALVLVGVTYHLETWPF